MIVSDLIYELQRMPGHIPVKVLLNTVLMPGKAPDGGEDWRNPHEVELNETDAIEADVVRFEGNHVLIRSR